MVQVLHLISTLVYQGGGDCGQSRLRVYRDPWTPVAYGPY